MPSFKVKRRKGAKVAEHGAAAEAAAELDARVVLKRVNEPGPAERVQCDSATEGHSFSEVRVGVVKTGHAA